ncbi:DUF736 domain-containing protein [Mesorhizobium sp. M0898]
MLTLDAKLSLFLGKIGREKAPHHCVSCESIEIGAAWDRIGKADAHLAVSIDNPSFKRPIRAKLFPVRRREKCLGLALS